MLHSLFVPYNLSWRVWVRDPPLFLHNNHLRVSYGSSLSFPWLLPGSHLFSNGVVGWPTRFPAGPRTTTSSLEWKLQPTLPPRGIWLGARIQVVRIFWDGAISRLSLIIGTGSSSSGPGRIWSPRWGLLSFLDSWDFVYGIGWSFCVFAFIYVKCDIWLGLVWSNGFSGLDLDLDLVSWNWFKWHIIMLQNNWTQAID